MRKVKVILGILIIITALPVWAVRDITPYIYGKASIGDVVGLRNLVASGWSLENTDAAGNTAYCLAVMKRNQTAIKTLEMAGANIHPSCLMSSTVVTEKMIYRAASNKDVQQLKQWQAQGINIDTINRSSGDTALCQAVYERDCEAIDTLLKAGASEYHICMRRVPERVRQSLDCRPVIINWSRIGMTVLGTGLVAGGLAVVFSGGGGNSGTVCAPNQHWDGKACVSCPAGQCWTGSECRVTKITEYADPETNRCMEIAPPVYIYESEVADNFKTDEYKLGGFLQHINAADAYAKGYSGYIVPRISKNPFGALSNEQQVVSDDNTPLDKDKDFSAEHNNGRVRVGVLSTGTFIQDTSDPTYKVNRDLAYHEQDDEGNEQTAWVGNLASDSGRLFGYNFDIGLDQSVKQADDRMAGTIYQITPEPKEGEPEKTYEIYLPKVVTKFTSYCSDGTEVENAACSGSGVVTRTIVINETELWSSVSGDSEKSLYYTSGTKMYFLGMETETYIEAGETKTRYKYGNEYRYLVLYDESKTSCGSEFCGLSQNYNLVPLKDCGIGDTICSAPPDLFDIYNYEPDYQLEGNETNPDPHYQVGNPQAYLDSGTNLAGIIAAIRNDKGMHGVAYNAEVIPAVADVISPISKKALQTLTDGGASIIVQGLTIKSTEPEKDGEGHYKTMVTNTIAKYAKGKTMSTAYGLDATNGYRYAANKGAIMVVGTGDNALNTFSNGIVTLKADEITAGAITTNNEYRRDASLSAGVPLSVDSTSAGIDDLFIAVTSVIKDTTENPSYNYGGYVLPIYAQPCGSTASYCLSAPGGTAMDGYTKVDNTAIDLSNYGYVDAMANTNLTSTKVTSVTDIETSMNNDVYGTGAAAAVVAGAAAVLKGAYPHLSSEEVVKILFQTASPLGACAGAVSDDDACVYPNGTDNPGYSTLYGWGLVNLDKATEPIGGLWVNNGDDESYYLGATYHVSGSSMTGGTAMSSNLLSILPPSFVAFDDYSRPFTVSTGNFVSTRSVRREFDDDFKAFVRGRDVTKIEGNDQFSMAYAPRMSYRSSPMKTGLMEMNVNFDKTNFGFYYTEDTLNGRGNYFERSLNNPFVQIQEAYGAEAHYKLTSDLSVGMSYAVGKNGFLGDGDKNHKAPENRVSMISTDAAYQMSKSVVFKASYGLMKEQDSVLGLMGTGAFRVEGATTTFASTGVELHPTDRLKLDLVYTYGWTNPAQTEGLMRLSHLTADGFAAVAQYDLGDKNLFGLSVSSPLRIRSGKASFNLPVGRSTVDDTIYHQTFTGSMKPTARELDFALFYRDALTEALTVQSELGVRLNPDHQKEASPDYRALFGLKWDY